MRQPITFAVVFIVAAAVATVGQPLNHKPAELPESVEARNALARLGEFSPAAWRDRLRQTRPNAYAAGPLLMEEIIRAQAAPLTSSGQVERLRNLLRPVLAYHRREELPIVLVKANYPRAALVDRVALVITTGMLMLVRDAELRGIVAHELAHEYIWNEHQTARRGKNESLLREGELFCDAVAAFTLKEIGDDPISLQRMLERVAMHNLMKDNSAGYFTHRETSTHPSLDTRKKLNRFLCQQFKVATPTSN